MRAELADVLAYLLRLADVLDVEIVSALDEKIALNEQRYPADLSRGTAAKYTELEERRSAGPTTTREP